MTDNPITYGSDIRLRNVATGKLLTTTERINPKPDGQNLVVGVEVSKDACVWKVHAAFGAPADLVASKAEATELDLIRLVNVPTGRRLHSHNEEALADQGTQEVTTFKGGQPPGAGDANDNWQMILVSPSAFCPGGHVRLRHKLTEKYLFSSLAKSDLFAEDESNISAVDGPSEATEWILLEALADLPAPAVPERLLREIEGRLAGATTSYESAQELLAAIKGLRVEAALKSADIDSGAKFADEKRKELASLKADTDGFAVAIRDAAKQSKTDRDLMSEYTTKAKVAAANAIAASEKSTELGAIAGDVEAKVKGYESSLQGSQKRMDELEKRIEDLLVGATSVGLGIAFSERAGPYDKEARFWRGCVLVVLVMLALAAGAFAAYHIKDASGAPDGWQLLKYLPIALPLIWLILYLQRQAAVAQRLGEEYAFKVAVSKSFEGYKAQLIDLEKELPSDAPIKQYYREALRVIIDPPGRIFEKHRPDVSPLSALAESLPAIAKNLAEVVQACKGNSKGSEVDD